ncbi:MAG: KamA family radical SAM protein [Leptospiraceae bacterium]|nr:KamA family radical SAM protein [Leptospiraceae bacterium]
MVRAVKHLFPTKADEIHADWQWQLRHQIRETSSLLEHPRLQHARIQQRLRLALEADRSLARSFRFALTPYYLSLINPDENGHCPVLEQILPAPDELDASIYADPDPLAEERHMPVRGLTHRYPDRVLWYTSHHCAVYCRFCLRKRKVSHADSAPRKSEQSAILEYIASHTEIKEVILSGGDPLTLTDAQIGVMLAELKNIQHIISIRIHTRMPVTLPMRITDELCSILRAHYPLTLVTHFNHAAEVGPQAFDSVRRLRMAGVLVLNQSVLLRNVNDTVQDQEDLILTLLRAGIKPYYLHRCDEVRGVAHFRVPIETGRNILRELRGRNPGIALPRYMIDLPGGGGKVPYEPDYLQEIGTDAEGHSYYRFQNAFNTEYRVRADRPHSDVD